MRRNSPANQSSRVQSPTTRNQYNLLRNEDAHTQCRWTTPIKPNCREPYYTKPCRSYWEMKRPSPQIDPKCTDRLFLHPNQVYRALLTQMKRPSPALFEPTCAEPYYTKPVEPVEKWCTYPVQMDHHKSSPKCTETYLHQSRHNLLRNEETLPC